MGQNKEKKSKPQVELHTGWWWYCEICGEANYERGITLDTGTLEAVMEVDCSEERILLYPGEVVCKACKMEYETTLEETE